MIDGVCCQYCQHFNTHECPVTSADPWSRWEDWCGKYSPIPEEPNALPLIIGVLRENSGLQWEQEHLDTLMTLVWGLFLDQEAEEKIQQLVKEIQANLDDWNAQPE